MRQRSLRLGLVAAALGTALVAGGCGGAVADGGDATVAPAQERVTITPETAANAFRLQKGTYRLNWKTTGCTAVTVVVQGDTGYQREKTSGVPNFSWILTSVTEGTYTVAQTDPACADWEILMERVGGGGG